MHLFGVTAQIGDMANRYLGEKKMERTHITFKEAVDVAVQLMDEVALKGPDARIRGMSQLQLMNAVTIIEQHNKRLARKKSK